MTAHDDIEDLFCQGFSLEHVIGVGLDVGWTREDVNAVLRAREWDLDGSGRLPRSKRMTVPRGLRGLPSAPVKTTSTTSRHRTTVPDRLDGHPLPTEPPTPTAAAAEQAALDVPLGDPPERWLPPLDDPRLPAMAASVTVSGDTIARATEIREQVDAMAPRANEFGGINTQHVAIEQTLRERAGLPSYVAELDGPGNFLPTPPLAEWEKALVADPFDPNHPALQVPDGFVPGGTDEVEPLIAPPPSPEPVPAPEPRLPAAELLAPPERPARMPCVVKPIMEPRTPINPATPPRKRPPAPLAQRGRRPDGRDLDDWLDEACRDDRAHVRRAAERACLLHEQLHDALDDLVRAEHNHARGDR